MDPAESQNMAAPEARDKPGSNKADDETDVVSGWTIVGTRKQSDDVSIGHALVALQSQLLST